MALRTWLRRCELDRRLVAGADPGASAELRRRAEKLRSRRERRGLAAALRRAVEDAERPPRWSAAAPVNRSAVLAERERLLLLARDLETAEDPPACGVALVERLLFDGDSALYRGSAPAALASELIKAQAALLLG